MRKIFLWVTVMFFCLDAAGYAQRFLTFPMDSQRSLVQQRIGLTDISIDYSRPAVKNRPVWGKLVPYNEVWRAGANENTVISFTDPVMVDGKEIPAGRYGVHMIPSEKEWTIILNKNADAWGSYFYEEGMDAVRFKAVPAKGEFTELLTYSFPEAGADYAVAELRWENLKIPFKINVNVKDVVYNKFKKELTGASGFTWQAHNQAAGYLINNGYKLDEAEKWIDKSISMVKNFANLNTKAALMEKKGMTAEAEGLRAEAMTLANEADMNNLGYQYLAAKKNADAIKIFQKNIEKYPESWNVYDSLAEAYQINGEKDKSLEYYKKALQKVTDETQKKRISQTIKTLEQ